MSRVYFCHKDFEPGLTCSSLKSNGECSGGVFIQCDHKRFTPKLRQFTPPPSVKPPKRKSTDCDYCEHESVCSLKATFMEIKKKYYPVVCECEKYQEHN